MASTRPPELNAVRDREIATDEALRDALCEYIEERFPADLALDAEALLLTISARALFESVTQLVRKAF